MRKALIFLGATLALASCTDADPHRECTQHSECADGQVCQFDLCVDEGSTQDNVCKTGFAYCGEECVDTQSSLATCGGCDGCPSVEHAEAVSCTQGVCQYTCTDDYRDRDDNAANGCDCPPGTDCSCIVEGPELCDLRDNDCDGVVDNVQLTDPTAEWRAHCPELPNAQPNTCQAGFCTYVCDEGFADRNDPTDGCECEISPEVCDGADNDCNGVIDDGAQTDLCPSLAGAVPTCFGTECVYTCTDNRTDVDGDLALGVDGNGCECQASGPEVCDGEDNDCDGLIDAEDDSLTTALCDNQRGVCEGARRDCVAGTEVSCGDAQFAGHAAATGQSYEVYEGSCDRMDNDCDGALDESCCGQDEEARFALWPDPDDDDEYWRSVAMAAAPDGLEALVAGISSRQTVIARVGFADAAVDMAPTEPRGGERLGTAWAHGSFWVVTTDGNQGRLLEVGDNAEVTSRHEFQLPAVPQPWFVRLCVQPAPEGVALIYSTGQTVQAIQISTDGTLVDSDVLQVAGAYVVDCLPFDDRVAVGIESAVLDYVTTLSFQDSTVRFGPAHSTPSRAMPHMEGHFGRFDQQERAPHTALIAAGDRLLFLQQLTDGGLTDRTELDGALVATDRQPLGLGDGRAGIRYATRFDDSYLVGNHFGANWLVTQDLVEEVDFGGAISSGFARQVLIGHQTLMECGVTIGFLDNVGGTLACTTSNRELQRQCLFED